MSDKIRFQYQSIDYSEESSKSMKMMGFADSFVLNDLRINDPLSTSTKGHLECGTLYVFTPSKLYPQLTLYNEKFSSTKKFLIRKKSIFAVLSSENSWRQITCRGYEGWIKLSDSLTELNHLERTEGYSNYEDWRGNNHFYFEGRIMLGSDSKCFLMTNIGLLGVSLVFFFAVLPGVFYYWTIMALSVCLFVYSEINLWLVATTEPGIIPRNPSYITPSLPDGASTVEPLGYKFCKTCNLYRPPRTKHCSFCQNCVEGFDHHCPFTSNCVGKRNIQFFFHFIISLTVYALVLCLSSLGVLIQNILSRDGRNVAFGSRYIQTIFNYPSTFVVFIVAFVASCLLLPFLRYHLHIAAIGQTTNEKIKKVYKEIPNPYDQGCSKNCYSRVFCNIRGLQKENKSKIFNIRERFTTEDYLQTNVSPDLLSHIPYIKYTAVSNGEGYQTFDERNNTFSDEESPLVREQ